MPQLKEFAGFYAHTLKLEKGSPVFHTAPTREIEYPFRVGTSLVVRLWPWLGAIVVGRWTGREADEEQALMRAVQARTVVASQAHDADDELELNQMLGLM
ncbi:hypothetical protein FDA94_28520 [Herbidospora galbida]|uniref:Uncharacterized protein n=1 Tax=Herbidospora galbida TaxID=2575442 RepID=A0A4U3MAI4_9ACTN|nr:hypothetical protein [Herbidospora galbida]TKK84576.1 hypothetical protein FDA94_28520 [Herbidospora galbida]